MNWMLLYIIVIINKKADVVVIEYDIDRKNYDQSTNNRYYNSIIDLETQEVHNHERSIN